MNAMSPAEAPLDMLIVGAGISGIGMAAKLTMQCPGKRYLMLDRRGELGGTWDLFRYPGIRSDSDMHTFAYQFAPWNQEETIASAEQIKDYLRGVVESHGIRDKMRFGRQVESADWDSKAGLWRVIARQADETAETITARFLFLGTGYYDYDKPYDAEIPGIAKFKGEVIHPQFWPEDFDCTGKQVVIIGSGATAVSVVPAMAEKASHVTMLQRTPTWYGIRPRLDSFASSMRRWLPAKWAWTINRARALRMHEFLFRRARSRPEEFGAILKNMVREALGEAWNEADYTPPYNPWEQRLCLVPDGDMFAVIRERRASVVTGEIESVTANGITLTDRRKLAADVIVTATGLRIATLGKIRVSLDGAPIDPAQHFWYRNCMFSNVPNLAVLFGYLNAGWTLRVDLVTDWLTRLLVQMDAWKVDIAIPVLPNDHDLVDSQPLDLLSSGYLQRGKHLVPKSSTKAPWRINMNYREDKAELAAAPIDDGVLRFERIFTSHSLSTPAQPELVEIPALT
ncbi:MAG: NAD(P)/FAD-dependent oxidoreductase [Novosphingobium sp.]